MTHHLQNPFVSSEDETSISRARLNGLSTGLEANGRGKCSV